MELPKIPHSIRTKIFYCQSNRRGTDWELVKKESNGKYTILKSIFDTFHFQIFECEINQNDINKIHEKVLKNKSKEYNLPIYLRKIKEKKYYPFIISIPSTDFTNDQKRIFSFLYEYKLGNLIGFYPFTKDKSPPHYDDMGNDKKICLAKLYQLFKDDIKPDIFISYFKKLFSFNDYKDGDTYKDFPFLFSYLKSEFNNGIKTKVLDNIIKVFKKFSL